MKHEEILQFLLDEKKKQNLSRDKIEELSGTVSIGSIPEVQKGKRISIGLNNIIKLLDAFGYRLVIEDKDAYWGEDVERLRIMPKKLYVGQRIETRELIKENGFDPRVDLFEKPEHVLKFMPDTCDIYEIRPSKLIRKKFDVLDHPFGTMYSYHEHIPPEFIVNRVTHR